MPCVREVTSFVRLLKRSSVSYTHSDAADERSSVDLGGRRIIKKKKKNKNKKERLHVKEEKVAEQTDTNETKLRTTINSRRRTHTHDVTNTHE